MVEGLPGNRLPDGHLKGFVTILEHLVGQVQHRNIKLDTQELADIGQAVEEVRIPAFEMDRHHISLSLDTL